MLPIEGSGLRDNRVNWLFIVGCWGPDREESRVMPRVLAQATGVLCPKQEGKEGACLVLSLCSCRIA